MINIDITIDTVQEFFFAIFLVVLVASLTALIADSWKNRRTRRANHAALKDIEFREEQLKDQTEILEARTQSVDDNSAAVAEREANVEERERAVQVREFKAGQTDQARRAISELRERAAEAAEALQAEEQAIKDETEIQAPEIQINVHDTVEIPQEQIQQALKGGRR